MTSGPEADPCAALKVAELLDRGTPAVEAVSSSLEQAGKVRDVPFAALVAEHLQDPEEVPDLHRWLHSSGRSGLSALVLRASIALSRAPHPPMASEPRMLADLVRSLGSELSAAGMPEGEQERSIMMLSMTPPPAARSRIRGSSRLPGADERTEMRAMLDVDVQSALRAASCSSMAAALARTVVSRRMLVELVVRAPQVPHAVASAVGGVWAEVAGSAPADLRGHVPSMVVARALQLSDRPGVWMSPGHPVLWFTGWSGSPSDMRTRPLPGPYVLDVALREALDLLPGSWVRAAVDADEGAASVMLAAAAEGRVGVEVASSLLVGWGLTLGELRETAARLS